MDKNSSKLSMTIFIVALGIVIFSLGQSFIPFLVALFVYFVVLKRSDYEDLFKDTIMIVGVGLYIGAMYYTQNVNDSIYFVHKKYFSLSALKETYGASVLYFFAQTNISGVITNFLAPLIVYTLAYLAMFRVLARLDGVDAKSKFKKANTDRQPRMDQVKIKEKFVAIGASYLNGAPVYIPYNLLKQHVCLVGTTGAGKTVTLYNFVMDALYAAKAVVFIDGKGDIGNIKKFKEFAKELGRDAVVITMDGDTAFNAFGSGTPSELTDKVISMFDWSEEHYKLQASRYLQLLISVLQMRNIPVNLSTIITYCDKDRLHELAGRKQAAATAEPGKPLLPSFGKPPVNPPEMPQEAPKADEAGEVVAKMLGIDSKAIQGLQGRIAALAEGDLRGLFQADGLSLAEAIASKKAVLFSLDSLRYPEQSRSLGRLITSDLKAAVSAHSRAGSPHPVSLFFDEFNVFASDQVVDIINKSRSAGFEALVSFQSLSDIDKLNSGEALRRQIIQNCNTLIVQKQNDSKDAEELSNLFGTFETTETTVQAEDNMATGMESMRAVHKFHVHPDDIKRLKVGQAFIKNGSWIDKIQVVNN